MIFMCSRGRREYLERFFKLSSPILQGTVLIDDDDDSYKDFELPYYWRFLEGKRGPVSELLNRAFERFPDEPYYAVVCDDMVYLTPDWDVVLSQACVPNLVSWGDDGKKGRNLCTSFFIGGDLVRKLGFLAHPGTGHLYTDTIWWMIASGSGLGRYRPEVKFTHTKIFDQTFRERSISGDPEKFEKIRSEIPELTRKALDGYSSNIA